MLELKPRKTLIFYQHNRGARYNHICGRSAIRAESSFLIPSSYALFSDSGTQSEEYNQLIAYKETFVLKTEVIKLFSEFGVTWNPHYCTVVINIYYVCDKVSDSRTQSAENHQILKSY